MGQLAFKILKEDDVRLLVRHPDPDKRAIAAQRICRIVRSGQLSGDERRFALRLLNFMAQDAADIVRRALAVTLQNSPELPYEIATKLIADIDNIAVPVLVNSPVLNDEDLVEVLRSKAAAKVRAVAKRPSISGSVVRAIIRFGDSHAVANVAANDGALIDAHAATEMLELYQDDDLIKEAMIAREDLPGVIAEKLITLVSEEVAIRITKRHAIAPEIAIDLANRTRERATVDFIDQSWMSTDVKVLTDSLFMAGRLTSSLVIRAVGCGQMRFAEHALARLSGVSHAKAALMIHDSGPFALKALCARAGITESVVKVIRAACAIYRDLEMSGIKYTQDDFQELMIERLLTLPFSLPETEQAYFLERLDSLAA